MDKQFEFLSFPTIYCGNTRVDNHLIISKQRSHELTIVFLWFLFPAKPTVRVLSTFALERRLISTFPSLRKFGKVTVLFYRGEHCYADNYRPTGAPNDKKNLQPLTHLFRPYLTNRSQITAFGDAHSAPTEKVVRGTPLFFIYVREWGPELSSGRWNLTIIPRARMGSESIAMRPWGREG